MRGWSDETKAALERYKRGRSSQVARAERQAGEQARWEKKWGPLASAATMGASGAAAGGAIGGPIGAGIGAVAGGIGGYVMGKEKGGMQAAGAIGPSIATMGQALSPQDRLLQQYDARQQQRQPAGEGIEWGEMQSQAPQQLGGYAMDDVLTPEEQRRLGVYEWS